MKQKELVALVDKYLDGTASEREEALLEQYYNSFQLDGQWPEDVLGDAGDTEDVMLRRLIKAVHRQKNNRVVSFFQRYDFRMIAALFLLTAGSFVWWMTGSKGSVQTTREAVSQNPPAAHKNKTTLTLSDGTVMVLDNKADGVLLTAENSVIRKQGSKVIIDHVNTLIENGKDTGVFTLQTPVGKQYEALLADGSQVWLNAASSLRFPVVFDSSERRVLLSGEAFFAVAKDVARPFRVLATTANGKNGSLVEVLGTRFNVNAYNNEQSLKTTLVEGAVKVAAVAAVSQPRVMEASVLLPGQQAEVPNDEGGSLQIKKVELAEVVAWKDNLFNFNNTDLPGIMRQLARWYDVEVVYTGIVPVRHFSGKINRSLPLSTVLEILEQSNIRFTVKGRQIMVKS